MRYSKLLLACIFVFPLALSSCSSKTASGGSSQNSSGDLSVSTSAQMPVYAIPGTNKVWTYTLTNDSTGVISNLQETGFSGAITHQGSSVSALLGSSTPKCDNTPDLQPDASCTYSLTYTPATLNDKPTGEHFSVNYDRMNKNGTSTYLSSTPLAITETTYKAALQVKPSSSIISTALDNAVAWQLIFSNDSSSQDTSNISITGLPKFVHMIANKCTAVAAGKTCSDQLTFSPTSASDAINFSVTVNYIQDGKQLSTSTNVKTVIGTEALKLSQTSMNLDTTLGGTDSETISLTNPTAATLTNITPTLSKKGTISWSSTSCGSAPFNLAAGKSCDIKVIYTPTTPSSYSFPETPALANLNFTYTQIPANSTVNLAISGHISYDTNVATKAQTVTTKDGNTAVLITLPITVNSNDYPIELSKTVFGTLPANFTATPQKGDCALGTAINNNCNLHLTYTPPVNDATSSTPTAHDINIYYQDGDPSNNGATPLKTTVNTEVNALSWKASCKANSEMSGYTISSTIGSTATCQYSITNNTSASVNINNLPGYLTGAPTAALSISNDTCSNKPLAVNGSCKFTLAYKPNASESPAETATLVLSSPATSTDNIPVKAGLSPTTLNLPASATIYTSTNDTAHPILVTLAGADTSAQAINVSGATFQGITGNTSGLQFAGSTNNSAAKFPGNYTDPTTGKPYPTCSATQKLPCVCPSSGAITRTGCDIALQYTGSALPPTGKVNLYVNGYSDGYTKHDTDPKTPMVITVKNLPGGVSLTSSNALAGSLSTSSDTDTSSNSSTITLTNTSGQAITPASNPLITASGADAKYNTGNTSFFSISANHCAGKLISSTTGSNSCTFVVTYKPTASAVEKWATANPNISNASQASVQFSYPFTYSNNQQDTTPEDTVNTSINLGPVSTALYTSNGTEVSSGSNLMVLPNGDGTNNFFIKLAPTANTYPATPDATTPVSFSGEHTGDTIALANGKYPGFTAAPSNLPNFKPCPVDSNGKPSLITSACYLEYSYTSTAALGAAKTVTTVQADTANSSNNPSSTVTFTPTVILAATDHGLLELNPYTFAQIGTPVWTPNSSTTTGILPFAFAIDPSDADTFYLGPYKASSSNNATISAGKLSDSTHALTAVASIPDMGNQLIASLTALSPASSSSQHPAAFGIIAYPNNFNGTLKPNQTTTYKPIVAAYTGSENSYKPYQILPPQNTSNNPLSATISSVIADGSSFIFTNMQYFIKTNTAAAYQCGTAGTYSYIKCTDYANYTPNNAAKGMPVAISNFAADSEVSYSGSKFGSMSLNWLDENHAYKSTALTLPAGIGASSLSTMNNTIIYATAAMQTSSGFDNLVKTAQKGLWMLHYGDSKPTEFLPNDIVYEVRYVH